MADSFGKVTLELSFDWNWVMRRISFLKKPLFFIMITWGLLTPLYAAEVENVTTNTAAPRDPYEKFNRAMFKFNDVLDKAILIPIATLYVKIVPKPVSKGLSNFYNNFETVSTVLNDVLQANFYQATSDFWRLIINSTVGVLGFFDVATNLGLEYNKEDFGLTLAHWGYKNSNYLVLPFLGPGTVRDQVGWMINYEYLSLYPYIDPTSARYEIYAGSVIVRRAELLRYQNVFEQAALDKYVFVRDAYLQRRNYQIERNKQLNDPYLEKDQPSNATE